VTWGDVLVLVGGNKLERFCYDFRPKIYAEIERASPPSGRASRRTIRRRPITRATSTRSPTLPRGTDESVDLTGDNLAHEAAAAFLFAKEARLEAEKREDAAKAELLDKLGRRLGRDAQRLHVRATTVASDPRPRAKPGEIIKGRRAYRRLQ
jgi:hypothetical protein